MALVVFFVAAVVASSLADLARARAQEAEQRRREADLTAELARLLLGGDRRSEDALPAAGGALARGARPRAAEIELDAVEPTSAAAGVPAAPTATAGSARSSLPRRSPTTGASGCEQRVVPALDGARWPPRRERERAAGARWSRPQALRRSDEIKTALLRSVSHDLRSPLTAIATAAEALRSPHARAHADRERAGRGRHRGGRRA